MFCSLFVCCFIFYFFYFFIIIFFFFGGGGGVSLRDLLMGELYYIVFFVFSSFVGGFVFFRGFICFVCLFVGCFLCDTSPVLKVILPTNSSVLSSL